MKDFSVKRKLCGVLIILAVLFIWGQSVMPRTVSSNESHWVTSHIIVPVMEKFMQIFGNGEIDKDISEVHGFVRKMAHVTEYLVVSFLMQLFVFDKKKTGKVILVGFWIAFLDETIQVFSGRGAMITDVWIDVFGVILGVSLGIGVLFIAQKMLSKNRSSQKNNV